MPTLSRPTDPREFVVEIENFAASHPVAELLCRIEDQFVNDWQIAKTTEQREAAWHGRRAVDELRIRIASIAGGKSVLDAHAKTRPRQSQTTPQPFAN